MTTTETNVRLFASPRSWIEGEAVRQLYATAELEGVQRAVGFPDLHAGRGAPVGAAFVTEGVIYPQLIGGDIGCGMALFKTDLLRRKARHDRWAELRFDLEHPWEGDGREHLAASRLHTTAFDDAMGTIGSGNHFAEVQAVEEIFDASGMRHIGLGREQLVVLVHSGSRGLGDPMLRDYVDEHHGAGAPVESDAAENYLSGHDFAVCWAEANRALIAQRFLAALGAEGERAWDGVHNSVSRRQGDGASLWVHCKGAVCADAPFVVIPGSRGTLSYLVKPTSDGESHAWSLAHGAGRKWARSESRSRMRERFAVSELVQTPLGGSVICEERQLLYEEAPAAYKNIEAVIQDLVDAGLVSVVATFRPLLTYKTRKQRR